MNTPLDQNHVGAKFGILYTDGVTLVPIKTTATGRVKCAYGLTVSQAVLNKALKDENYKSSWLGVSSVDGVTPIPLYVDATGAILINN